MKETFVCCCDSHKIYHDGSSCPGCKRHDPANAKPLIVLKGGPTPKPGPFKVYYKGEGHSLGVIAYHEKFEKDVRDSGDWPTPQYGFRPEPNEFGGVTILGAECLKAIAAQIEKLNGEAKS